MRRGRHSFGAAASWTASLLLLAGGPGCSRTNPAYELATTEAGGTEAGGTAAGDTATDGTATDDATTEDTEAGVCRDGVLSWGDRCLERLVYDLEGSPGRVPLQVLAYDDDAYDDVVLAYTDASVRLLRGSEGGLRTPGLRMGDGLSDTTVLAVGDLDGMGAPDYVVASGPTEGDVGELRLVQGGALPLDIETTLEFPASYVGLGLLRLDPNPSLDVVALIRDGRLLGLLNDASLANLDIDQMPCDGAPTDLVVGDLGGSAAQDVALACRGSNQVVVLYHHEADTPAEYLVDAQPLLEEDMVTGPNAVEVGDWNGDGRLDLFVTREATRELAIYLHEGGKLSEEPRLVPLDGRIPRDLAVADFDDDGRDDVVVVLPEDRALVFVRQRMIDDAVETHVLLTDDQPWAVATGDVDGNGTPDVVTTMSDAARLLLLRMTR